MKMTDGKRTVEIEILKWNGTGYDPDWSNDYFSSGHLPHCDDDGTYIVEDVGYCIDIASNADDPESAVYESPDMEVYVTELPNVPHYRVKPECWKDWNVTEKDNVFSEPYLRESAADWGYTFKELLNDLDRIGG